MYIAGLKSMTNKLRHFQILKGYLLNEQAYEYYIPGQWLLLFCAIKIRIYGES